MNSHIGPHLVETRSTIRRQDGTQSVLHLNADDQNLTIFNFYLFILNKTKLCFVEYEIKLHKRFSTRLDGQYE